MIWANWGIAAWVLGGVLAVGQTGSIFYVAKNGSDGNPGTITAPWLTIQHAADTVAAGATVYVEAGVYNESVHFPASGAAGKPITFASYPGQTAAIDGTGLGVSGTRGLVNIVNRSYITIAGFEIRNYTTASAQATPAGIWVTGAGEGVRLLNNKVHDITTQAEAAGNAFGIAVYGTQAAPIGHITISGNEVYNLRTGSSESVNVDGNVTNFTVTNNAIHDNDNIGFDAIGGEQVGPVGHDRASYGEVSGNTIYRISSLHNPAYGGSYGADGLYCDGCRNVVFERNLVYQCDIAVEAAAENAGFSGSYVTIRNNVLADNYTVGVSIGGYGASATKCKPGQGGGCGSSDHVIVVNNSFYNDNTANQGGEFQIQYRAGATNIFENNVVYAGAQNVWIYGIRKGSAPVLDWNDYYSLSGYAAGISVAYDGAVGFATFGDYQNQTQQDGSSFVADPDYTSTKPPKLALLAKSPAIDAGGTGLSCAQGYCGGSGSIYGDTDFAGKPRRSGSGQISMGAYQQ